MKKQLQQWDTGDGLQYAFLIFFRMVEQTVEVLIIHKVIPDHCNQSGKLMNVQALVA